MYAVIKSGGKQYRVVEGQKLKLDTLPGEAGETIQFDKVLMVANGESIDVGAPYLESVKVAAEVVGHGRHKKIKVLKFKRRKQHIKRMGHRQDYTEVKIAKIEASAE